MWNSNAMDISMNGGFVTDGLSEGSATKKRQQTRRAQSLVPLFISYITGCKAEELTLFGMPVQMVDIVGVIRKFEVQSTKATCVIEDHSGSIDAVLWFELDDDSVNVIPPIKENCYARIRGSIRTKDEEKMIMILKVTPVDDLNVITNHHLQVLRARLYADIKAAAGGENIAHLTSHTGTTAANSTMSYADVNVTAKDSDNGFKPLQQRLMLVLKDATDYMGMPIERIMENFNPSEESEVRNTLNFLLNEGYVYTTCDTNHYKATDSCLS